MADSINIYTRQPTETNHPVLSSHGQWVNTFADAKADFKRLLGTLKLAVVGSIFRSVLVFIIVVRVMGRLLRLGMVRTGFIIGDGNDGRYALRGPNVDIHLVQGVAEFVRHVSVILYKRGS
jgi:hypothetical protein